MTHHVHVPVHAPQGTPCTYVTSRCGRVDAGPHPDQPLVGLLERARVEIGALVGRFEPDVTRHRRRVIARRTALLSEIDEALRGEAVLEQGGKSR